MIRSATGKIDKKLIRTRMADYVLPTAQAAPAAAPVALAATRDATLYAVVEDTDPPDAETTPEVEAAEEPSIIPPGPSPQVAEALAGGGAAARLIIPEPDAAAEDASAMPEAANDAPPAEAVGEPSPEAAPAQEPQTLTAPASAEAPLTLDPKPATPAGPRPPSTVALGFLNVTLGVAAVPIVLAVIGAGGHAAGLWDQHIGYDVLIQDWARKFAMAGFVTGALGFLMAAIGGFRQLWFKAAIALFLTIATTAGLGMANTANNPPVDPQTPAAAPAP